MAQGKSKEHERHSEALAFIGLCGIIACWIIYLIVYLFEL
jgi:hypothetical protein